MTLLSYLRQRLFCLLEVRYDRRWNIAVVFVALCKFMNFMKYLVSYPVNKIVLERVTVIVKLNDVCGILINVKNMNIG